MNNGKVSVVMCVYNGEKYLDEAIKSIINQTYENIEFIICNDGSTDGTKEILSKYQAIDNRLVILNKENTGLTSSLDFALKYCSGIWIARQDADDVSMLNRIEKQVEYCIAHNLDFVTARVKYYGGETLTSRIEREFLFSPKIMKYGNVHVHGTFLFRAELLDKVSYNINCRVAQDFDFILQCCNQRVKCGVVPEVLYLLRLHDASISKNNATKQITTAIDSLKRNGFNHKFYIEGKWMPLKILLKFIKHVEYLIIKRFHEK